MQSDNDDLFDELVAGFKLIAHNAKVYEKQAREGGDLVAALMGLEIVRKHAEEYVKKAEE